MNIKLKENEEITTPTQLSLNQYFWQFLVNFLVVFLNSVIFLFLFFLIEGNSKEIISSQFKPGEFIINDPSNLDSNWMNKKIFPASVKKDLTVWMNSWKYFSLNLLGEKLNGGEHLLFFGPPGSGKTYLALTFARHESLAYVSVNFGAEFFVGSSKSKQEKIFKRAKEIITKEQKKTRQKNTKPIVIIIDEIDSIGTKNFSGNSSNSDESANGLLTLIDKIRQENLNIIIIGTTNHPSVFDSAILRSGRFGTQIEFPYPTTQEIGEMITELKARHKFIIKESRITFNCKNDYWNEIQKNSQDLGQKYKEKKIGITILDLEKSLRYSWAKKIVDSNSEKIINTEASDYKKELEEVLEKKLLTSSKKKEKSLEQQTLVDNLSLISEMLSNTTNDSTN